MKVLFIGGTGLISKAVSPAAIKRGMTLTVLNRGNNNDKLPDNVECIVGDVNDESFVSTTLKDRKFDVVVDWIAFEKKDVERDYRLFKNITEQYIFISSASVYQKPVKTLPITEKTPLENPFWEYSRNKIACEKYLYSLNDPNFNVTVVRPSHTYDETSIVFRIKSWQHPFTMLYRIINEQPVVIPGDGNTLWTLTHHKDFAEGFLDLFGNIEAYHEDFTLTSDKTYTWNALAKSYYKALDKAPNILHIPHAFVIKHFPELEGELYGDNYQDTVFDNTKIKSVAKNYKSEIEYTDVVSNIVNYYLEDTARQTIDEAFLKRYDAMIKAYQNGDK